MKVEEGQEAEDKNQKGGKGESGAADVDMDQGMKKLTLGDVAMEDNEDNGSNGKGEDNAISEHIEDCEIAF